MKTTLNAEIVKNLVQELQGGFAIYVNTETGETKTLMEGEDMYAITGESYWDNEKKIIEEEWTHYEIVHPPASHASFEYLESFVDMVDEPGFRNELGNTLQQRRPFANFKALVESSKYREDWFAHQNKWFYNYLVTNLGYFDIRVEE